MGVRGSFTLIEKKNPPTNAQLLVSHEMERYVFARNDSHSDVLFVVVVEEFSIGFL